MRIEGTNLLQYVIETMSLSLTTKAILGVLTTPLFLGVPVFLAAGTLNFWQGWAFVAVFWVATALHTADLIKNDPELLRRRMKAGPRAEKRSAQKLIMVLFVGVFLLLPIVGGLDHRRGWSHVPVWLVILGDILIALSYLLFHFVFRQNRFAAATIQVEQDQKVVSTGLYGIVRHPMYCGAVTLLVGMALALASYPALVLAILGLPSLHWRIEDEEKCLIEELPGYDEYRKEVRWRLIPGLY